MTEQELRTLGHDCYAAFNQAPPGISSRAWTLWAEMCAAVPFEASLWIRGKIIELDAIPRNFGKAVRNLAAEWRSETGQPRRGHVACGSCDTETPGFFTVWRDDGCRMLCRCRCNDAPECVHMPYRTPYDMAELGYVVRPSAFQGHWLEFENQRFARTPHEGGMGETPRRLTRCPVKPEMARPAHKRLMEDDYALV